MAARVGKGGNVMLAKLSLGLHQQNGRCLQGNDGGMLRRFASGGGANPAREARAAQPSKVVKKGGAAAKEEGGPDKRDRFASLIKSCLDSPSPVRALKEKDRLREVAREKLGIVSKEKERALEREKAKAKAAAKEKKKGDKSGTVEVAGETTQSVVHNLTPEEGMRLAKEYSRHLMKESRLHAAAENVRLQLKKEAIAALPPHLREAALVPDLTPFPPTRIPAALSPPIPGYVEEMTKAAEQASKIQKLR